jgi:spore coat polysaccharide biosynthesis protein SpsF
MKLGIVVQARMSSQRLPGKVLEVVEGKPMLQYTLERLQRCTFDNTLVVATSREEADRPIVAFCEAYGVACHQGPLADVAGRFKQVIEQNDMDAFVRVCGDSPLLDQELVARAVGEFVKGGVDVVTNVMPRTYPPGCSVEVIRRDVFLKTYSEMASADAKEHVTKQFYAYPDWYRILNFAAEEDFSSVRLCVDTEDDMDVFRKIVERMDRPHWEYRLADVVKLYRTIV